jgi:uncharacterized RDD family membrane protein YckC
MKLKGPSLLEYRTRGFEMAGLIRRSLSIAIDLMVISIMEMIFLISGIWEVQILKGKVYLSPEEPFPFFLEILPFFWAIVLIPLIYFTIFHGMTGQTFGKMILSIRVVMVDGTAIGYRRAFLRFLGYIISILLFGFGFLWAIFNKNRQCLHDRIAKTIVIRD